MTSPKSACDYEILWYSLEGIEERLSIHHDAHLVVRSATWSPDLVVSILTVSIALLMDVPIEVTQVDHESYYVRLIDDPTGALT